MKRTLFITTITLMFLLSGSLVLARSDEAKGQGGAAKAEKQVKAAKAATEEQAAQTEEKVKAEQRSAEKQAKAAKEKADQAAAQAEEKTKAAKEKAQGQKEAAQEDVEEAAEAAGKGKGKSEEMKGQGKGQAQKAEAQAKQLEHEAQKHETRKARLAEMLKVAQDKGDEKAIARIEQLIEKEQTRYDKKHAKMTGRGAEGTGGGDKPEQTDEDE